MSNAAARWRNCACPNAVCTRRARSATRTVPISKSPTARPSTRCSTPPATATASLCDCSKAGAARWRLPPAASLLAHALPVAIERRLGDGVLELLDKHVFAPSQLPLARRQQLSTRFERLLPPYPGTPPHRILFRKSRIGPNAFALPSGDIVMTDEMVNLMQDDDALMGVLAHELGHLHERHLTRRIIQGSAVAASATLLFGDVSSVIAALPPLLLDLKYSRDAEREADDYAIAMLRYNGIAPEHLAEVFVRLDKIAGSMPAYLSSHPASRERIAHIRAAAR